MTFATPLLLIGLLAAGIPPLLHLMSRVRAKDQPFPTLRFLRQSMEKTARRRRLQNWLLLAVRSLLLAVLAVGVAEPIVPAGESVWGGGAPAAVAVLDTSYSMNARATSDNQADRFSPARAEAGRLLSGDNQPNAAALLTAAQSSEQAILTPRLDELRKQLDAAGTSAGQADLASALRQAGSLLDGQTNPNRQVWLFSDLQRLSVEPWLAGQIDLGGAALFVVCPSSQAVDSAGIPSLRVAGPAVAGAEVEFVATVRNSSPRPRTVEVELVVDGRTGGGAPRAVCQLAPAGQPDAETEVRFTRRFAEPGLVTGRVRQARPDALPTDDERLFAFRVRGPVRAVVVAGPGESGGGLAFDPAGMLRLALDWRGPAQRELPWPICERLLRSSAFGPETLRDADAAFFCEVPTFDAVGVRAIRRFVRSGGTAWFFLGPGVRLEEYNRWFYSPGGDGLLPAKLAPAVGQVGDLESAQPLGEVDVEHPLLAGLYDEPSDYRVVLTQRHVPLPVPTGAGRVLLRLAGGDALLIERPVGKGRVVWSTVPASSRWSNLPVTPLLLPMVVRSVLLAGDAPAGNIAGIANEPLVFSPPKDPADIVVRTQVTLTPPDGRPRQLRIGPDGTVRVARTDRPGIYRWVLDGTERTGAFAINPFGPEGELSFVAPDLLRAELARRGVRAYVGTTVDEARSQALEASAGRNDWDLAVATVVLLLVFEGLLANRRRAVAHAARSAGLQA